MMLIDKPAMLSIIKILFHSSWEILVGDRDLPSSLVITRAFCRAEAGQVVRCVGCQPSAPTENEKNRVQREMGYDSIPPLLRGNAQVQNNSIPFLSHCLSPFCRYPVQIQTRVEQHHIIIEGFYATFIVPAYETCYYLLVRLLTPYFMTVILSDIRIRRVKERIIIMND
jgi:hypothetical protein